MKKVGILTFYITHNYGAVLQCYALQEVLKSIGANVQIIDYRQPYIEKRYAPFLWHRSIKLFAVSEECLDILDHSPLIPDRWSPELRRGR